MKNNLILTIVLLIPTSLCAQNRIKVGINKTHKYTYEAKLGNTWVVRKYDSLHTEAISKSKKLISLNEYKYADKEVLLSGIRQVFSPARLKQLLPENFMGLIMDFNKTGKVINVTFILNKNSTITTDELANLESVIESSVIVLVPNKEKTDNYYAPLAQVIKFQKVIDGTL